MKQSSNPTLLVSVALAVLLWLAATLFEDDSRWLPSTPPQAADAGLASPRTDSAVRIAAGAPSCGQVEADLTRQVDEATHCATDDDCTLFDFGYPMQCMTSVSKDEITALRLAYRSYEQSCAYRVYYDCPTGEFERQAVCRSNRCAVELVSSEPLQDETLHHIGVDRH